MKRIRGPVCALLVLAAALPLAAQQVVEEIVAVVNSDVITLSQYKTRYEQEVRILQAQFRGEDYDKQFEMLKTGLLEQMISEVLLMQMARDKQIDVREQLKISIDNIKKANNLESDEDLKLALARDGQNYEAWVKAFSENLMRQAVIYSEVDRQIVIDDAESMAYYKAHLDQFTDPPEYKLRAIVLPLEDADEAGLEAQRKDISDKLRGGADFNALAGEYNQGGLKDSQGSLGSVKKAELDPALAQAADALKAGDVSAWLKGKNAWYLLKLEERTDSRVKPYSEAKKDAENKLYTEKKIKAVDKFFNELKAKNYIKIVRPDPLGN